MTRRERMIRIIQDLPWGEQSRAATIAKLGFDAFTDEAIEHWARRSAEVWKRHQRFRRENRASARVSA